MVRAAAVRVSWVDGGRFIFGVWKVRGLRRMDAVAELALHGKVNEPA